MIRQRTSPGTVVELALEREAAEEIALLEFLKPYTSGLGIAQLHGFRPDAVTVADRLAAKGHLTRYPGCLFGVSDIGQRRLAAEASPLPSSS